VLSAGCDDFIRKPFTEDHIFEVLAKHLGIQYIYAEIQPILDINSENELISEELKVMSKDWMNQLYQASIEADSQAVIELIADTPDSEIDLRQFLAKAVRLEQITCKLLLLCQLTPEFLAKPFVIPWIKKQKLL
jgi:hypothetical protein